MFVSFPSLDVFVYVTEAHSHLKGKSSQGNIWLLNYPHSLPKVWRFLWLFLFCGSCNVHGIFVACIFMTIYVIFTVSFTQLFVHCAVVFLYPKHSLSTCLIVWHFLLSGRWLVVFCFTPAIHLSFLRVSFGSHSIVLRENTLDIYDIPHRVCQNVGCFMLSSGGFTGICSLTLSLLMSYIYGAPCKARNFNVVYIWTYVWQRWK
jgi:hypothetical protein